MLEFEGLSEFLPVGEIEVSILKIEIDNNLLRPLLIVGEEKEPPRSTAGMDEFALV